VVTILAQLVFTPIIVKLYDPVAYGSFGFILSLSTLLLSLFTLQYDRALFLAREEQDVAGLRAASNAIPFYFSMIVLLVLLVAQDRILELVGADDLGNGIFLLPLLVVFGAWSQTSQRMVAVRYRYREGFLYGSAMVVGSKLMAILYGVLVGSHFVGLALAELFNRVVQQVINYRIVLKEVVLFRISDLLLGKHRSVLVKYIGFPKYELPAVAVAAVSNQIPIFWIPKMFGLAMFGQYSLALSLLEMPMRLFGYSLSGIFYQKAARTYQEQGGRALASITHRMMISITAISAAPLLVIALFAEPVFSWVFGETWVMAGAMSSRLCIVYFFRLLIEPVSSVLRVIGEQRNYFLFHGNFLILRLSAVAYAVFAGYDVLDAITVFAVANALGHASLAAYILLRLKRISGLPDVPPAPLT
jgi:O-antigen/teichoic acid export membrane protein